MKKNTEDKKTKPETAAQEQPETQNKQTQTAPSAAKNEAEKDAEQAAPADPAGEKTPSWQDGQEAKIAELGKKVADSENARLRLLADMDNLRKRCAKDIENTRLNTVSDTIDPFLTVFDHFSMAMQASKTTDNVKSLVEGMKMILAEFNKAFSALGVECIDAVGKDFDPELHQAVSQEASETVPEGKVIRQWSCGYKTSQRLIKPAMVIVSSGKPEKTAGPAGTEKN